jgi:hypothetical protein
VRNCIHRHHGAHELSEARYGILLLEVTIADLDLTTLSATLLISGEVTVPCKQSRGLWSRPTTR